MPWIDLVTLLAVFEFLVFALAVAQARTRFGVRAPATTGDPVFERYMRVQQNTLEMLIMFIPSLWMAAHYFDPRWIAAIGGIYIVGRLIYFRAYISAASKRTFGFMLSIIPIVLLALCALFGVARALLAA